MVPGVRNKRLLAANARPVLSVWILDRWHALFGKNHPDSIADRGRPEPDGQADFFLRPSLPVHIQDVVVHVQIFNRNSIAARYEVAVRVRVFQSPGYA